mmetsp:Transcript_31570/g.44811  ORF Transcript_31570/g.44811 Transcript_31570/m.44811 type:complete len:306 (+) Transcript_31570:38-955(+)
MGQEQSYEKEPNEEEYHEESKDEASTSTRSTVASTVRTYDSYASVMTSRSSNGFDAAHATSSRYSLEKRGNLSTTTSRRRTKQRMKKDSGVGQNCVDPFALHGIAIESFDTASLPSLLGSMVSNSSRSTYGASALQPQQGGPQLRTLPERTVQPSPPLVPQRKSRPVPLMQPNHRANIRRNEGESLPAPVHEMDAKIYQYAHKTFETNNTSRPVAMRASSQHSYNNPPVDDAPHSAEDAAYLSRLYDLRTWNMYKRITEARQDQNYYMRCEYANPRVTIQIPTPRRPEKIVDLLPNDNMIFALDM